MHEEKQLNNMVVELASKQGMNVDDARQVLAIAMKSIGVAFRSIGEAMNELFNLIREPLEKLNELFVQQRQKEKKRSDPKSGWIMKFDMRKPSQVLLNKPKYAVRKVIK